MSRTQVETSGFPTVETSTVVAHAPGPGDGYWAGDPSAVAADGATFLAYRLRRPVGEGRGYANVVARSEDGVSFEPLVTLTATDFGCDSLERPALGRLSRRSVATRSRSRRTAITRCATPRSWPCPTAGPGSTSKPRPRAAATT